MFVLHAGGDRTRVAVTCKNEILEANAIIYRVARCKSDMGPPLPPYIYLVMWGPVSLAL